MTTLLSPTLALLLLTAGILLLYVECNRPGLVLPASLGVVLTLTALAAFHHLPLRPAALALLALHLALSALAIQYPLRGFPLILATLALLGALLTLTVPPIHPAMAWVAAPLLTGSTVWLARTALRARRLKFQLHTPNLTQPRPHAK